MKSLGNKFIESQTGPAVQIADPSAADELLDLAIESARHRQRLLFFCGCQWPRWEGKVACHRTTVVGLLLKAARRRGIAVSVVEWPGGRPRRVDLKVPATVFDSVRKGRMSVPLGKGPDLAEVAGLPWGSVATLHSNGDRLHRVVGPAVRQPAGWTLPVLPCYLGPAAGVGRYETQAEKLRTEWGLTVSRS